MKRLLLVALVLVGCGGEGSGPIGPATGTGGTGGAATIAALALLEGTWQVQPNPNVQCVDTYVFTLPDRFGRGPACVLPDQTFGAEVEKGSFSVSGDRLYLAIEESTCPVTQPRVYVNFQVSGTQLTVTYSNGAEIFNRATTGGSSGGAVAFGCFTDAGFTKAPLSPVGP